jgi:signal transduction histidine kinase
LIFVNLLSNAIKYSDPTKSARRVEVTNGDAADGACVISIADNGVGIPESALPTIFARFTRAQPQRDDVAAIDGMGLGLSIVADCVRAVGGRVDVLSRVGEGTTFVLTLPYAPGGMLLSETSSSKA